MPTICMALLGFSIIFRLTLLSLLKNSSFLFIVHPSNVTIVFARHGLFSTLPHLLICCSSILLILIIYIAVSLRVPGNCCTLLRTPCALLNVFTLLAFFTIIKEFPKSSQEFPKFPEFPEFPCCYHLFLLTCS